MTQPLTPIELDAAIVAVYRGPLDEFVSRRDALVKQLRAAKCREDADRVKSVRKPSRMAWVLDNIVHEDSASIEQLAAAISAAQTGTDLRAVMETVKTAVLDVAAAGARVAIRAGHPIEANAIAAAVHAVIGDASAFAELRAGRLVDVPEAGGLDMLTAIQVRAPATTPSSSPPPSGQPVKVARAEASLADMRKRLEHAEQSVRDAQQRLDIAERELLNARAETQGRRADVERARQDAEGAASAMRDAEQAVAAARAAERNAGT